MPRLELQVLVGQQRAQLVMLNLVVGMVAMGFLLGVLFVLGLVVAVGLLDILEMGGTEGNYLADLVVLALLPVVAVVAEVVLHLTHAAPPGAVAV
jgi:hypothetical protein